ncbi:uncharacterized protein LOC142241738 isoform X2 [Haematobia irritans]
MKENKKENSDTFIILVDDLRELDPGTLSSPPPHPFRDNVSPSRISPGPSSSTAPIRCPSLDSCHSRDQFLISMVNEFLNDADDTVIDETTVTKSPSLNMEYMEEPQTEVESLIDFHHIKDLPTNTIASPPPPPPTPPQVSATRMADHNPETVVVPSTTLPSTLLTLSPSCSTTSGISLVNESSEMPTILLTLKSPNTTPNMREISYQRFGRINRNLPAEVHNFKCHLCAFSCKRKELLLQHFQDKHPT